MPQWHEVRKETIMKKFLVFNGRKLVEIKASVIAEYEEKVGVVTENTINYLIATLGLTEEMDASALTEEIEKAMIEDCADSVMVKEILSDKDKREELF